jgi:lysophospholipase L1-like esterase
MKRKISIVLVLVLTVGLIPGVANAKLIACVGDSITYGHGISNRNDNSYPAQLAKMLQQFDNEWDTQNFGHSGATLLSNTNLPYVSQNAYNRALASEPDVVIIMLGTNDSARASISRIEQDFIPDYLALIDAFIQLSSQPRIFVCYPPPIFGGGYGNDNTIRNVIIPLIDQLPTYRAVEVIDMYTPLEESRHLFPDQLHPNAEGAEVMAEIFASVILGFRFSPDFNGDWKVDIEDLIILIEHWGQNEPTLDIAPPPLGDSVVDRTDLEVLMTYWGQKINDPTLIAHWALDETEGDIAYDSAGNYDGTLIGDPVWQPVDGMVTGALKFDGINDYVEANFVLNPQDGPFSALALIKGGAPGDVIISQADGIDGAGATWLGMNTPDGYLMTGLVPPPIGRFITQPIISESVVTNGQWYHVGFVWDGTHRHLYVDGVEVAKDANPITIAPLKSAKGGLFIGTSKTFEAETLFSGLIDDVRIYNVALTAEQISALAQ